jgi:gliding motility-associated-like protein
VVLDSTGVTQIQDIYPNPGTFNVCLTVTDTLTGQSNTVCQNGFITVFTPPQAAFSASNNGGCIPFTVQYTDNSVPGSSPISSWLWTLPGSSNGTYTVQSPSATYNSAVGSPFDGALRVTDANGCESFVFQNDIITANAVPVANFSAQNPTSCSAPHTVNFINSSTGTGPNMQYTWNFGDGNTATGLSPSHTYTACGTYTVALTATNLTTGCSNTRTLTNLVQIQDLTPTFTPASSSVCLGSAFNFTNTSVACVGTFTSSWDFGDGTTSNLQNPSHVYTSPGNYSVLLTITTPTGCVDSVRVNNFSVINSPIADFGSSPTLGCSFPFTVNFTNQTSPFTGVSYNWNFGDPTSGVNNTSILANPSHTYNACGNYTVRLIASFTSVAGCADTIQFNNYVHVENINANFASGSATVCENATVSFNNTSTSCSSGVSYLWDFGDGSATSTQQFPAHVYTTPGCFAPVLIATTPNGCVDTTTISCITVQAAPVVNFVGNPIRACNAPLTVTFNDLTVGSVAQSWNFNLSTSGQTQNTTNGTATYTYTAQGTYDVALTVTSAIGCQSTDTLFNYVQIQAPQASFTTNEPGGCAPYNAGFTATTVPYPGDNIVSYTWDFGDPNSPGQVIGGQNISHVYADTGCYNVSLIIQTAQGCRDTVTINEAICTGIAPTSTYVIDTLNVCINGEVIFDAEIFGPYDTLVWIVSTNGGYYYNQDSITHLYDNDTTCYPIVFVAGYNNCFDTIQGIDTVCVFPPLANFDYQVDCSVDSALVVLFTDRSGSTANYWDWDFGVTTSTTDVSTAQNPSFTYPAAGTYTVRLIVGDSITGCIDSIIQNINVSNEQAFFTLNRTNVCAGSNIRAINVPTGMASYAWSSAFASSINLSLGQSNPRFFYALGGTYIDTIKLIMVDPISTCSDTFSLIDTIDVHQLIPNFTALTTCGNLSASFTDNSTTVNANITNWSWNFGNAQTSTQQNPTHAYLAPGVYTVQLQIRDVPRNCIQSRTQTITISNPQAAFALNRDSICLGSSIQTINNSTNAMGYQWSSTAGSIAFPNAATPTITYSTPGIFQDTISLIAVDSVGNCFDTLTSIRTIRVSQAVADFSADITAGCAPVTVSFTDNSTSNIYPITNWLWNFGVATFNNNTSINHVVNYPNSGNYNAILRVTNSLGCIGRDTIPLNFVQPVADYSINDTVFCPGEPLILFNNSTSGLNYNYTWIFGNGDTLNTTQDTAVSYNYTTSGTYNICLIVTDPLGCTDTLCRTISVSNVQANFTQTNTVASCPPLSVTFTNSSIGNIDSWFWNFGDGNIAIQNGTSTPYINTYNYPGNYPVSLTVTDIYGCASTLTKDSLVQIGGPSGTFTYNSASGCTPLPITFTINTVNATSIVFATRNGTYNLVPGPGGLTILNHTYNVAGDFTPFMQLTDAAGCQVTFDTTGFIVTESLTTNMTADNTFSCDPDTFNFSGLVQSSEPPTIAWVNNGGTILTSDIIPDTVSASVLYSVPGANYSMSLIASNSLCADTITVGNITMPGRPVASFVQSYPDVCNSHNVQFVSTSTTPFGPLQPNVWDFGDGTTGTGLNPLHVYSIPAVGVDTYSVSLIIENAYGCFDTATQEVYVYPQVNPYLSQGDSTICLGSSFTMIAAGALNISWAPGTSLSCTICDTTIATPTVNTQYIVTYSNNLGCILFDTADISVIDIVPIIAPPNPSICIGSNVQLTASGGNSYQWSPTIGLNNPFISTPVATPLVTTTYEVLVTSAQGCQDSTTVTVTVNPLPTVSIVVLDTFICPYETTQLIASTTASNPIYQWNTANPGLSNYTISNPIAAPTTFTVYSVTVTDGITGCTGTESAPVFVFTIPAVNIVISNDSICPGDNQLITLNPVDEGAFYQWSPAISLNNPTIETPTASPLTTTTYTVTITFPTGCTLEDSETIYVTSFADLVLGTDTTICNTDTATLAVVGTASFTIEWTPAASLNDSSLATILAFPDTTTWYTATVQREGCTWVDSARVRVIYEVPLVVSPDVEICLGETTQLLASGGDSYQWTPATGLDASNIANPVAGPSTTTTYAVTAFLSACIPVTDSIEVTVHPLPTASITASETIVFPGQDVELSVDTEAGNLINWSPITYLSCDTCSQLIAVPDAPITYIVTTVNEFGCLNFDTITINIFNNCTDFIVVPNAFTPNNDGMNDELKVLKARDIERFSVYDRWGAEIFNSTSLSRGWDGTYNGKPMEPGVYVYYVIATCPNDGTQVVKTGNVTLIR